MQVECYTGANFDHFPSLVTNYKGKSQPEIIDLNIGINARNLNGLKPRGYSTRFLTKIKSETVKEIENPLVSTEPYKPYKIRHNLPPRIGTGYSTTCNETRCRLHNIIKYRQLSKVSRLKLNIKFGQIWTVIQ